MRNTRLYIIISVVVLIIVGIIASILSGQLKKAGDSSNNNKSTQKVETTGARSLSRTEQYREAARITKQQNTSLLSDDQIKRFNKLSSDISKSQNGIITNNDFEIGYSNITNLFCVQKKTPQGDAEFKKYLTEKQALDIYEKDPSLFIMANENCSTYLKKQEEFIIQDLELDENISDNKAAKTNKLQKDAETFSKLIKIFSSSSSSMIIGGDPAQSTESAVINGINYPPNLGSTNADGYYKMPPAPNGEYTFGGWNFCGNHSYGNKELIGAIYTAALRWKAKYPQYTFRIGDLNGRKVPAYQGHSSHGNGVDVDIVTYGNWNLQINAPTEVNIDLGKAFIDTGITKLIIIGGKVFNKNAPIVQNALKEYANSKGLPFQTYGIGNHDNHFHIRINDQFRLKEYRPSSPC